MEKKKEKTQNMTVLIPANLHRAFKKACVDRGYTIKQVIMKSMEDFMAKKP